MNRVEQLREAVALGDELLRLIDAMPSSMAGPYVSLGVEILREQLQALDPLSTPPDTAATCRSPDR